MTAFPDLVFKIDGVNMSGADTTYHRTLTGTDNGSLMRAGNRRLPRRLIFSRKALYTRYSRDLPKPCWRTTG